MTQDNPTDTASIVEGMTSGERLRHARELRGLSLAAVSQTLRLPVDVLKALEAMDDAAVSGSLLRMRAISYANFLALPAAEIANGYGPERERLDIAELPSSRMSRTTREQVMRRWPAFAAALGLGLIVATYAIVESGKPAASVGEGGLSRRVAVLKMKTGDAQLLQRGDAQGAYQETADLTIRAVKAGWIEVRGADGTIFRSRDMQAGEVYYPRIGAGWSVTVRDGGAFEWMLGDDPAGAVGPEGVAIYSVSVDEAARAAREARSTALAQQESGVKPPPR